MFSSSSFSQPSSSPTPSNTQIFVDTAGHPLPIFVESNGIRDNRPKLIRTLRNYGANICVDVSLARIIVVEPHTSEGRQFVRDWGMDPGKVILEVAWIHRCLEAGRALLENEAWGGCGNLDGTPLENEPENDGDQGLFTHSRAFGLNGEQSSQPHTRIDLGPSSRRRSSLLPTPHPAATDHNAPSSVSQFSQDIASSSFHRSPTPPPPSVQTQVPLPFNTQHQVPQQFSQNALPNVPNMPNMTPNMLASYGQLVPQPQFNINGMNPQMMNPQMLQAFMSNPEMLMNAMTAMMMMQGMTGNGPFMPPGWQGQAPQSYMQLPSQVYPTMQPVQPQPLDSVPSEKINRSLSPLPTFTTVNDSESDSSSPPTQSILRQRARKRHRESSNLTYPKPPNRSRSPSDCHSKKRNKKRPSLSTEHTASQGLPLERNQAQPIGIFTHRDGKPMTFFVQVQMRNRQNIIKQIKINGGKIEADPPKADFILLDTRPGKDRDLWMKTVRDSGRFALGPGFIEACVNSKGLVEEDGFIIESKRRLSTAQGKNGSNSAESEEHESPSVVEMIMFTGGRNPFTSEEIRYALRLAEYLLRENYRISMQQLGDELASRAPRHPAKSWMNLLYKEHRAELELIRDQAAGQERRKHKGSPANALSGSEPEVEAQLMQPVEATNAESSSGAGSGQPNGSRNDGAGPERVDPEDPSKLYNDDLKTIIDFFANPPAGVVEDEALWIALASKHNCRTASRWQNFYEANQGVVDQRLRDALNIRSEDTTT
ncbi:hypothetical protein ACEPAF_3502 [Sanghuangporus sanghuang]|uniref:BRCT domain-containing protein n=1 Tax=Sanghuangporus baumii TaxID=108892 RepID=A0A9Q5NBU4_SANBA|nr:hypothetical protein A7U60_g558 [Sanghuangporus baumii]